MRSSANNRRVRWPRFPPGIVPWRAAVERLLKDLIRALDLKIEIEGADAGAGGGGSELYFRVKGGGAGGIGIHPFYIYPNGEIHAGTVGVGIPELGGVPIGEGGPSLSLSGSFYVYIEAVFSLEYGDFGFLNSAELDDLRIITSSTPKTETQSSSTLHTYRLIAQVVDSVVRHTQPTTTSLNLVVCDNSTGAEGGQSVQSTWTPS